MSSFKYTFNLEAFERFFKSKLLPELEPLSRKKRLLVPFIREQIFYKAFETTCKKLGRFAPYKGKIRPDTYKFLKCLHFFPDFTSVKYKGCFKGKSAGKDFEAQSIELIKDTGKSCVKMWNGMILSVPFYKKTAGSVLFQKYDKDADSDDVVKIILKKREFVDIIEKNTLNDNESYLDVIKENYHTVFKSDSDKEEFFNEKFAQKLFVLSKKYNCHISLRVLNNNLFIALKAADNTNGYTSRGWFDFSSDFADDKFMKDIFQQFETVVMVLKVLNS